MDTFKFLLDIKGNFFHVEGDLREKNVRRFFSDEEKNDSTSWLEKHFKKEEKDLRVYQYNPLSKKLILIKDNNEVVKKWCEELDWKKIYPRLIIKDVVNPFKVEKRTPNEDDISNLKKWAKTRESLLNPLVDKNVVYDANEKAIDHYINSSNKFHLVGNINTDEWFTVTSAITSNFSHKEWSELSSIFDSFEDSLYDYTNVYATYFFDFKFNYDYSSFHNLWNKGLVPSYDGTKWRLHSGEKAEIVWEGEIFAKPGD
jgi:hypothetical protein